MIRVVGPNPAMDRILFTKGVQMNDVNRLDVVKVFAGGKGLDVARTVRTLGKPVSAYGFLGGVIGEFIRERCRELEIIDRHTHISGETRICFTLVEDDGKVVTVFNEPGPMVTVEESEDLIYKIIADSKPEDLVILSGSLPEGVSTSFYGNLLQRLKFAGIKTIVDASGEPLKDAIKHSPWMIKPNIFELQDAVGHELRTKQSILQELYQMLNNGTEIAIVTLGHQGLIVASSNKTFSVQVPVVKAVNPIASGDTFLGGFTVRYQETGDLEEAVRFGTACAVANAMSPVPDLPGNIDLDSLCRQVKIEQIGAGDKDEVSGY